MICHRERTPLEHDVYIITLGWRLWWVCERARQGIPTAVFGLLREGPLHA